MAHKQDSSTDMANESSHHMNKDSETDCTSVQEHDNKKTEKKLKDSGRAWVVCIGSFFIQVMNVGTMHAYGIFFVAFLEEFKCSRALVAWIGALAYGITMAFGMIASPLINKFGHGPVASVGSAICATSLLASSFVNSIELLFLTFSLLYGIGCSLSYTPTMCIADDYFEKYVSVATGIMTAGSSVGTLILNPMSQSLISHVGWRNALRFLSGISLLVIASGFTFKRLTPKTTTQRLKLPMTRRIIRELQLWKNKVFVIYVVAITLVMFGYYIPYVHLVTHAEDMGIPPETGSILVMVLGGATATGRLLFGKILEIGYLNRNNMHQMSMVVTGSMCMILPLIRNFYGLLAYCILIGLVDGCYVVLLPVMSAQLAGDDHRVMAWGFLVGISSITYTLGPPVAGWIADATGSYDLAFHVAGIPIICGAVVLFLVPWATKTAKTTNFMSAAKPSYSIPHGTDDDNDGNEVIATEKDENDSIFSGPMISLTKVDEDARTINTIDSGNCLVINLKTGTISGLSGRYEDGDTVSGTSELSKLHDIAQAIEIMSRASASIIDNERASVMSSDTTHALPVSASVSRQETRAQPPNQVNISSIDLETFFDRPQSDQSSGVLLSPYCSPMNFLGSPHCVTQARLASNQSLPGAKETKEVPRVKAEPRRTRYLSVPVDFMDHYEYTHDVTSPSGQTSGSGNVIGQNDVNDLSGQNSDGITSSSSNALLDEAVERMSSNSCQKQARVKTGSEPAHNAGGQSEEPSSAYPHQTSAEPPVGSASVSSSDSDLSDSHTSVILTSPITEEVSDRESEM